MKHHHQRIYIHNQKYLSEWILIEKGTTLLPIDTNIGTLEYVYNKIISIRIYGLIEIRGHLGKSSLVMSDHIIIKILHYKRLSFQCFNKSVTTNKNSKNKWLNPLHSYFGMRSYQHHQSLFVEHASPKYYSALIYFCFSG